MAFGDIILCTWTTLTMHLIEIGNAQVQRRNPYEAEAEQKKREAAIQVCFDTEWKPTTRLTGAEEMGVLGSIFRRGRVTFQPARYYDEEHGFRHRRFLNFPLGELLST